MPLGAACALFVLAQYEVYSGSNYDWIDYRGNILGTDVQVRPDIDFRELVRAS
jgi:hypothetical protein